MTPALRSSAPWLSARCIQTDRDHRQRRARNASARRATVPLQTLNDNRGGGAILSSGNLYHWGILPLVLNACSLLHRHLLSFDHNLHCSPHSRPRQANNKASRQETKTHVRFCRFLLLLRLFVCLFVCFVLLFSPALLDLSPTTRPLSRPQPRPLHH